MATTYKTPGVYVEEISNFPPSVAQVETAIPAFVGYTERAVIGGKDYHALTQVEPIKVSSLPDYEFLFGGAPDPTTLNIELDASNNVASAEVNGVNLLYDSVRMFYANGGGDCYIVSVGAHNTTAANIDKQALLDGLATLEKVDRPTLLVVPECVHLDEVGAGEVHGAMLLQCNKMQDRFSVLDMVNGDKAATPTDDPIEEFRNNVGMNYLKYGAAYYPWIKTTLPFQVSYDAIIGGTYTDSNGGNVADITAFFNATLIGGIDSKAADLSSAEALPTVAPTAPANPTKPTLTTYATEIMDYFKEFFQLVPTDSDATDPNSIASIHTRYTSDNSTFHGLVRTMYDYLHFSDQANNGTLAASWAGGLIDTTAGNGYNAGEEFATLTLNAPPHNAALVSVFPATATAENAKPYFDGELAKLQAVVASFVEEVKASREQAIDTLSEVDPIYKGIAEAIAAQRVTLPPSGAIVGVYAAVDNNRGVWKAPANVSLSAVVGPTVNITHKQQENINVDVVAGKSVNAIRTFTGKGHMV
ncbi:MAG: hypothetical protein ACPG7E_04725, partial [Marinirhabdus sp.]